MINYNRLEQNIVDMVKEEQAKLGYCSETVRFYYPLQSLNQLLQTELDTEAMMEMLVHFFALRSDKYGAVEVSEKNQRFCVKMPPKAADYIHETTSDTEFIVELVNVFRDHNSTLDDVVELFKSYSNNVAIEKKSNEEFDYLIYFADGKPDDYRYLISCHHGHMTYHRFMIEDYDEMGF